MTGASGSLINSLGPLPIAAQYPSTFARSKLSGHLGAHGQLSHVNVRGTGSPRPLASPTAFSRSRAASLSILASLPALNSFHDRACPTTTGASFFSLRVRPFILACRLLTAQPP